MDFIRDDYYMQAGIADLTACFNEELRCKSVTEQAERSKIAMEADSIFFDGFNDIDEMFLNPLPPILTHQRELIWNN